MIDMLLAIPDGMQEIWYVYDIILVVVIAVCAVILAAMRRKSNLKEGQIAEKWALRKLHKVLAAKPGASRTLDLYATRNYLRSAKTNYGQCVAESDMYNLLRNIAAIDEAVALVDDLLDEDTSYTEEQFLEIVNRVEKRLIHP